MRYASVCSGVEAASLAWGKLGWTPVFFAEVEPFPCAVLMQRFNATKPLHPLDPAEAVDEKDRKLRESWLKQINKLPDTGAIPNLGDFTKIQGEDYVGAIDLLVGGTPCQDLSVAGKRAGFEGARSSLALDFVRLAYEARCQYFVWENVPGVFSSNRGGDFATLLSMFCGYTVDVPKDGWKSSGIVQNRRPDRYGLAWRVLDAQFTRVSGFPFAVPQRRRRVFLVGCLGDWERAASILLEPDRLQWDTPPRRTKRQSVAAGAEGGFDTTKSIRQRGGRPGGGKGPLIGDDISHTLATGNDQIIVTLAEDAQWWDGSDQAGTLTGTSNNQLMPDKGRLQCVIEPAVECIDMRLAEVQETELAPTMIATDYKGGKAVGIGRDVFNQGQNAKYGMSLSEDVQPTLTSRGHGAVCFENHPSDARLKEVPVSPTVISRWGTDGNQVPLVMDDVPPLDTTVGFIKNDAGDEQQGFWGDTFPTLRSGALPAVAYNVTFCDANGTRKDRPDGGLYVTEADASKTVTAGGTNAETVVIDSVAIAENIIGRQDHTGGNGVGAQEELAYTQNATGVMGVATMECVPLDLRNATRDPNKKDEQNQQGVGVGEDGAPMNTITSASIPGVGWQSTVRKILPVECERLMGFPDNHTRISWNGKPEEECPDGPRYKAAGNSMCVNCMEWIGRRIEQYS